MIAALIQGRLDSSRLPNKAIFKLENKRIIEHCIDAVKSTKYFTPILITTNREIDNPLEKIAIDKNILFYRGELENVAKRAYDSLNKYNISYFARINGDSPFIIGEMLDDAFLNIIAEKYDFASNIIKRTFPYGISIELFNAEFYASQYKYIKNDKVYSEHYTKFFYDHLDRFNFLSIENDTDLSSIRTVVDTKEDFEKAKEIVKIHPNIFKLSSHKKLDILKNFYL